MVGAQDGTIAQQLLPAGFPESAIGIVLRRKAQSRLILQPYMPRAGITGGHERVVALAADPDDVVEPAAIAQARLSKERDVGDERRVHALVPEDVGQDQLVGPKGRPSLLDVGKSESTGPPASPGGKRRQVLGKVMVEHDAFGGQPVEVGRLDPGVSVGTDESQMQAVADDDDHVHGVILADRGLGARSLLQAVRHQGMTPSAASGILVTERTIMKSHPLDSRTLAGPIQRSTIVPVLGFPNLGGDHSTRCAEARVAP